MIGVHRSATISDPWAIGQNWPSGSTIKGPEPKGFGLVERRRHMNGKSGAEAPPNHVDPGDPRDRILAGTPLTERRLQLGGVSTAVLEGGEGPPVVLLHGQGAWAGMWLP